MSRRLEVLLHDRPVGILAETPGGIVELRLLGDYRELVPRPVLGQKFEDDLERVHRSRRRSGVPDFFANVIPEGRLRDVIVTSAGLDADDDLALLAFVGSDLPGAVTVRPFADEGLDRPMEMLSAAADRGNAESSSETLRFSLAGAQLKFSLLREGDRLTLPLKSQRGEWIVKLDSPAFPNLPANEYSMLEWARAAGFEVPECRLHTREHVAEPLRRYIPPETQVIAVRRYDRSEAGPVHQEDFAQAVGVSPTPPERKYNQITYDMMVGLVRRFIDEGAVDEFIRRLVLTVAIGNNDAHLKNWSLIYPDKIRPLWSPLYDQVSTVAWEALDRTLALKLGGTKDFGRVDRSLFERLAQRSHIDARKLDELVTGTIERLRTTWREVGPDLPLPETHRGALRHHWRKVPLLRSTGALD